MRYLNIFFENYNLIFIMSNKRNNKLHITFLVILFWNFQTCECNVWEIILPGFIFLGIRFLISLYFPKNQMMPNSFMDFQHLWFLSSFTSFLCGSCKRSLRRAKVEMFARNGPCVQELKATIANRRQNDDNLFIYGKMKHLWDKLTNYQIVADCCCGGHSCSHITYTKRHNNEEKLINLCSDWTIQFLTH